jgi:hypothetical protein
MSFWQGFEKQAAGAARVDRLMGALKKRKLPAREVHGALRGLDLKNQVRGLNPHVETSVLKATASAAKSQADGGFSAPWETAKPKGGHE